MINSIGAAWLAAQQRIDRLDARLLIQHVAGCRHADFIARPELPLSLEQLARLEILISRRADGEPLAYLLGSAEFYGREFAVSPAVLIPRPETEGLVTLALDRVKGMESPRILDLGTGSGIIAVTLALEKPGARVTAVDVSPEALEMARGNAERLGARVDFRLGSWFGTVAGERFDLIVSNPPYVALGDPHLEQNGLPFEPQIALTDGVAGAGGLACIRAIVGGAPEHLEPGGWLLFEHGYDQGEDSRNLLQGMQFKCILTQRDLAGIDRISGGQI
ncbi:MAG TPA: peptide chain release factor N(5)-glutamine methyltransferase [Rhodocyclaceae bacterium]|nr:peptide chain release factor N(5)-glutamine methyltransferase [Rhodocyclaceae bacterium]